MPLDGITSASRLLSIPDLLKATPQTEGDHRYLYLEASNEVRDLEGEVVQAKALQESADYFLRYGNFDIQHRSFVGQANGDPDYYLHEIGRPIEVKADGTRTFVKGEIYHGPTRLALAANDFWDSLTILQPPARWYPSVGGKIEAAEKRYNPDTNERTRVITKTLWSNIGFSRTPVNSAVPMVSTMPFGVLAKCWGMDGLNVDQAASLMKALEAGYGTDVATLSGGAALREQSLDGAPQTYETFREKMAADLRNGKCGRNKGAMVEHAKRAFGLGHEKAGEHVAQFLADMKAGLQKGKNHAG